jgi:hypothetical protein
MVLRGEVVARERESSGITSGYVGGSITCSENCAIVREGKVEDIRGSGLSVSGMTRIRYSVGDSSAD